MSILRSLAKLKKIREKNKETRCDIDLTVSESTVSYQRNMTTEIGKSRTMEEINRPTYLETGLGSIDHEAANTAATKPKTKRGSYQVYSENEKYKI